MASRRRRFGHGGQGGGYKKKDRRQEGGFSLSLFSVVSNIFLERAVFSFRSATGDGLFVSLLCTMAERKMGHGRRKKGHKMTTPPVGSQPIDEIFRKAEDERQTRPPRAPPGRHKAAAPGLSSGLSRPRKRKAASDVVGTRVETKIPGVPLLKKQKRGKSVFLSGSSPASSRAKEIPTPDSGHALPSTVCLESCFDELCDAKEEFLRAASPMTASGDVCSIQSTLDLLRYAERSGTVFHNVYEEFQQNWKHRRLNDPIGPQIQDACRETNRLWTSIQNMRARCSTFLRRIDRPSSEGLHPDTTEDAPGQAQTSSSTGAWKKEVQKLAEDLDKMSKVLRPYCVCMRRTFLYGSAVKDRLHGLEKAQRSLVDRLVEEIVWLNRVPLGPSPPGSIVFGQEYIGGPTVPQQQKYVGYEYRNNSTVQQRAVAPGNISVDHISYRTSAPGASVGDPRYYAVQPFNGMPYKRLLYKAK